MSARLAFALVAAALCCTGCTNPERAEFEQEAANLACEWNRNFRSLTEIATSNDYFTQWPLDETCEAEFLDRRLTCNECEFDGKKARKCLKRLTKLNDVSPQQLADALNGGSRLPKVAACQKIYDCPPVPLLDSLSAPYADCQLSLQCAVADGRGGEGALWLLGLWVMARRRRTPVHRGAPSADSAT